MAKKGHRQNIILTNDETGHSYHTTKNKNNTAEKISIKKYDPVLRKHVVYKEKK